MRLVILLFWIMLGAMSLTAYGQEETPPKKEPEKSKEIEKTKEVEKAKEASEKTTEAAKELPPGITPKIMAEIEEICMYEYNACAAQCDLDLAGSKSTLEGLLGLAGGREELEKSDPELLEQADAELDFQFNACLDDCEYTYNKCIELGISLAPSSGTGNGK